MACWWGFFIIIAVVAVFSNRFKKTEKGRYWIDKTMLLLPGIGILVKKLAVARFARTLGSLLENGVSMLIALDIVKNIEFRTEVGSVIRGTDKWS